MYPTRVTVKRCGMKFSVQNDRNLNACIRETVYRVKDTLDQPTHVTVKCCGMKISVQNDRNLNACIRETVYRVKDFQQLTPSSVQI